MKALSIRQPWAWLILHAGKDVENRTWNTAHTGPLLIHAAKGMTPQEYEACAKFCRAREMYFKRAFTFPDFRDLPCGGIVGQVTLLGCVRWHHSPWFTGGSGWLLRDPQPLTFLPWRGLPGLFEVPLYAFA